MRLSPLGSPPRTHEPAVSASAPHCVQDLAIRVCESSAGSFHPLLSYSLASQPAPPLPPLPSSGQGGKGLLEVSRAGLKTCCHCFSGPIPFSDTSICFL